MVALKLVPAPAAHAAIAAGFLGVFYLVGGSGWEKVGGYVTMALAFTAFMRRAR
jgi:hypothetical protein